MFYGSDSPVLDGRLRKPPKDHPPRYAADLAVIHGLISRGPGGQGDAYRFHGLKSKHREEYAELEVEARGQGKLP